MAAAELNLYIEQGATFSRLLTVEASPGSPLDLTGMTAQAQIRYQIQSSDVAATFTCTVLDQTTNTGEIRLELTAAETALLTQPNAAYDVELVDGATITRLLEGQVFISSNVTR